MKPAYIALLVPFAVLACPSTPSVYPAPSNTDMCGSMCDHLAKLGCEEGKPLYNNDLPGPNGVPNQSCSDNCVELQNKGLAINPKCVLLVDRCTQIEDFRKKDPATCEPSK